MSHNNISQISKLIKEKKVLIPLILMIGILLIIFCMPKRGRSRYVCSFDVDYKTLPYAEISYDANDKALGWNLGGHLFEEYYYFDDPYFGSYWRPNNNGIYLTEDMFQPDEAVFFSMNDDCGILFFSIEGLSKDEWLALCYDYGNGQYSWLRILKEETVEIIPELINNIHPARRKV